MTKRFLATIALSLVFASCDVLSPDSGEFAASITGDKQATIDGRALLGPDSSDPRRSSVTLASDTDYKPLISLKSPIGGFREGTHAVSPGSGYNMRWSLLLRETHEGVSGTITITSASDGEVEGRFEIGLSAYETEAYRFIEGDFRAVAR